MHTGIRPKLTYFPPNDCYTYFLFEFILQHILQHLYVVWAMSLFFGIEEFGMHNAI